MLSGCRSLELHDLKRIAAVASYTIDRSVTIREKPDHQMWDRAKLVVGSGPKPSEQAKLYLRRYDVENKSKLETVRRLKELAELEPGLDKEFTIAELAFQEAETSNTLGRDNKAKQWYMISVYHSYRFLFSPTFANARNAYAPEFRMTVDFYNRSLENLLKIMNEESPIRPNESRVAACEECNVSFDVVMKGPWKEDDFEKFEFANDYLVKGVGNQHRTEGVGVPLIGVRHRDVTRAPHEKYYPTGLALPVTAFLRFEEESCLVGNCDSHNIKCQIELHDSLKNYAVKVAGRTAPLESDITTPLAYFLENPLVSTNVIDTVGFLDGKAVDELTGLYMLEPYDPNRVPVVLVHGLWSSPLTWLEMFNELRAIPDIRERYQFWFYFYPTGQPFWVSAKEMREDLAEARAIVDPQLAIPTLDQMVLVGHSMGGLVSRLQTVDSGNEFWNILSDQPFESLQAAPEVKQEIQDVLFFRANPSIKRVVTISTPHEGSEFANTFTKWLAHKFIRLPDLLNGSNLKKIQNRNDIFKNQEILTTKTSIDSLAADSPFLQQLLVTRSAPWVRMHTIYGNTEKRKYFGFGNRIKTGGDGIVSVDSANHQEAISQLQVTAKHTEVHRQPAAVLEVRRILSEHAVEVRQALANDPRSRMMQIDRRRDYAVRPANFQMNDTPNTGLSLTDQTSFASEQGIDQPKRLSPDVKNAARESNYVELPLHPGHPDFDRNRSSQFVPRN